MESRGLLVIVLIMTLVNLGQGILNMTLEIKIQFLCSLNSRSIIKMGSRTPVDMILVLIDFSSHKLTLDPLVRKMD